MKRTGLIGCGVVVVIFILILVFWGIGSYNSLVGGEQSVNSSWAQVENNYQRRADLIPNLVNTVKGYASHEQETFTKVMEARARATSVNLTPEALNDPNAMNRFQQAQGELSGALSRLMVVVENYPNLKANENFLNLQSQLEGTENRITVARQDYNNKVETYNVSVRRFPGSIFAGIFGFREKAYFRAITPGAETAPNVDFNK